MSGDAAALQKLLAALAGSEAKDADLVLMQLAPEFAHLFELCAIPHAFDETLVRVLDPAAPTERAAAFLAELPAITAVHQTNGTFTIHDVVRQQMFQRWLAPEHWVEFSAASRRLASYFAAAAPDPAGVEANRAIVVFHAIGADLEAGFAEFQALYDEYRRASHFSACENLVRLVGEYRTVLSPVAAAWLSYYEAKTASDSRNPARAASLLTVLAEKDLPPKLAIRVLVQLSAALRETNRIALAEAKAERALTLVPAASEAQGLLCAVHRELGLIALRRGDAKRAEHHLRTVIKLARAADGRLTVASAYNSLGMLLEQMAPRRAIEMFRSSMAFLDEKTDLAQIAQVLNNLGMAYANAGEWDESRRSYERSLEIKRASRDPYGQAVTLLNVARVYRAQKRSFAMRNALGESATLFEVANDPASAASARRELARALRRDGEMEEATREMRAAAASFVQAGWPDTARELEQEFTKQKSRWRLKVIGIIAAAAVTIGGLVYFATLL